MVVDIDDIVTYANFGDHRLRGFWVAGGQIPPPLSYRLSSSPLQHSRTTVRVCDDETTNKLLPSRLNILWLLLTPRLSILRRGKFDLC